MYLPLPWPVHRPYVVKGTAATRLYLATYSAVPTAVPVCAASAPSPVNAAIPAPTTPAAATPPPRVNRPRRVRRCLVGRLGALVAMCVAPEREESGTQRETG